MSWALGLVLAAAVGGRPPEARAAMVDLAYVLGQSHALRLVCNGASDQAWRIRMNRLIEVEKPDEAFRRRLIESFNAGFMTAQADHPGCDPAVAAAEQGAAERGRALAERLSGDDP